jgi:hypothetical protein
MFGNGFECKKGHETLDFSRSREFKIRNPNFEIRNKLEALNRDYKIQNGLG